MSGVAKAAKKIFKKVVKVVKKIWKPVLAAVAIYFTAGLALSYFPATASFAASMPGFAGGGLLGTGIGGTAGTGIFTKIAAKFGLAALGKGGGLVGGALAKGTSAAALAKAGVGAQAIAAGAGKAVSSGLVSSMPQGVASTVAASNAATGAAVADVAAGGTGAVAPAAATKGSLSLADKLLLASTGTKLVSGLLAPSPRAIAEAQKRWSGAFYGDDGKGGSAPPPPALIPPEQPRSQPAHQAPLTDAGSALAGKTTMQRKVQGDVASARSAMVGRPYRFGSEASTKPTLIDEPFESLQEQPA